jgi:hypothetical protein
LIKTPRYKQNSLLKSPATLLMAVFLEITFQSFLICSKLLNLSSTFLLQKSWSDAGFLGEKLLLSAFKNRVLSSVPDNLLRQISRMGKVGKVRATS